MRKQGTNLAQNPEHELLRLGLSVIRISRPARPWHELEMGGMILVDQDRDGQGEIPVRSPALCKALPRLLCYP